MQTFKIAHQSKIEKKLNPTDAQIGGGDGPETNADENGTYVKILSYSVTHVSVLVHLEKDGENNVSALENPQISYNDVSEYSIEQQLRLGCDNKGNMYNYSVVLTRHPKENKEESAAGTGDAETGDVGTALSGLGEALGGLAAAVTPQTS